MNETQGQQMLPIGTLLQNGKYRVVRYMASGGFGNTYEVEHVQLHKRFALKEFFMRGINLRQGITVSVSQEENRTSFNLMREKFYHEAQRLATLEEAHVVQVSDFFEENQTAYYVMKLINGSSLSALMKQRQRPFTEWEVRQLLPQVLSALRYVHAQGLCHLDLKPGNIMMGSDGHCTLIDFGASKQLSAQQSQTLSTSTGLCYTPGYAPSEQINGNTKNIGPWTDFYALGATIYNLLTNRVPPSSDDIMNDGMSAFAFPPEVSMNMRQLVEWLMKQPPRQRPQNVAQIEQMLFKPVYQAPPVQPAMPTPPSTTRPATVQKKSNLRLWMIIAGSCLLIALFVALLLFAIRKVNSADANEYTPAYEDTDTRQQDDYNEKKVAPDYDSVAVVENYNADSDNVEIATNIVNNLVFVDGGTFIMGGDDSEAEEDEMPTHRVSVSSFWISKYEVTQREWKAVMGSNPSQFRGDNLPVECVSWNDCQEFIRRLNKLTDMEYRLPTEAEWEFAARGGNSQDRFLYAGSNNVDNVAWYMENSGERTHAVGKKGCNSLGLYDMSGNVREWCQDWYSEDYYWDCPTNDPCNQVSTSKRVNRSCSWGSHARYCRVANRDGLEPNYRYNSLGLRLAH